MLYPIDDKMRIKYCNRTEIPRGGGGGVPTTPSFLYHNKEEIPLRILVQCIYAIVRTELYSCDRCLQK